MAAVPANTATDSEAVRATRIEVRAAADSARIATLAHGELVAARPLSINGRHVRIALVGIRTALLAGDELDLRVRVGAGVTLEVIEATGMVAYDADGQAASWCLHAEIGASASLIWRGRPFVAAQGSNVHRATKLLLDRDARVLIRETLVLGRSAEPDVRLRSETRAHLDGRELLVEDLHISRDSRRLPGITGSARSIGTVAAAGWRPKGETNDPHRLDFAGPGALFRALGDAAHQVENRVAPVFDRWRGELSA
jgi:urease accessory protein